MKTCTSVMQSTLYSVMKKYNLKFHRGIFNSTSDTLETC